MPETIMLSEVLDTSGARHLGGWDPQPRITRVFIEPPTLAEANEQLSSASGNGVVPIVVQRDDLIPFSGEDASRFPTPAQKFVAAENPELGFEYFSRLYLYYR